MSFLVDHQIKKAVEDGEIKIDPFDPKRLAPAGYYITLGKDLLIPKKGETIDIGGDRNPEYRKVQISQKGYTLKQHDFILGETEEILTIPHNYAAFIDGRSSLARLGLEIHQTASFIFPGHTESIITLEIKNSGMSNIVLRSGVQIAKLIFFRTDEFATKGYKDIGDYAHQPDIAGAKIKDNH